MPDAFDVKSSEQTMLNVVSLFGLQTGKNGAWFCAECVSKDLQIHGIPYWRRDHQLCGVNWCYRHRRKLLGFSSHSAFDKSPPVHLFGIQLLRSDGPQFLDDTAQIVQSFATISKALLERQVRLSPTKVADSLRSQALKLMHDGGRIEQFCLQNLAEEKLPNFWKKNFYQIKGPGKDKDLLNFNIAFRHSQYSAPTVLYVIALALLFETPVEALLKLDEAEDVRIVPENMKLRYEREFCSVDYMLHEYVKNRGSYDSYSPTVGTDSLRTSNSLKTYGLPNLSNVSEQHKIALLAFFEGTSLFDICQTYHVEITDIENILRIAGSRLAKGLFPNQFQECRYP